MWKDSRDDAATGLLRDYLLSLFNIPVRSPGPLCPAPSPLSRSILRGRYALPGPNLGGTAGTVSRVKGLRHVVRLSYNSRYIYLSFCILSIIIRRFARIF